MTTKKNLAKQALMSIAAAGIFTFSFSSCSDEIDSPNTGVNDQQAPEGARTELLEAYGLTFENFINEDDVIIIDADTTQLSVSKAYADKMGITSFVNHPMGIWHKMSNLPYIRKATSEKLIGDRYILNVVPATVAEIMGEKKMNLQTNIYVNKDAGSVKTRAAGNDIPEYAAKYIDNNNVIHPAAILLTDPYGYDKDYHTADEKPSATQTRAAKSGEFQYITAEELAGGNTRWSSNNRIIAFENELEKQFQLAVGKDNKDSVYMAIRSKLEFGLNYFITLEGGVKWNSIIPDPYLKKFEAGLDGNFGFEAELALGFTKEWKLDEDAARVKLFTFKGYTFTFWVGPVPVAITTDPHLDFALDAKVSGSAEIQLKYQYANSFKAGFGWADGQGFYPITEFNEEADDLDYDPTNLKVHAEAGVGLYLVCDLKLYGLAGPKLGVGPRLGAEIDGETSFCKETASLKGKIALTVNAVIGAKVDILGYELADEQLTFPLLPDKEWILWAFNWELEEGQTIHQSPKAKEEQKQLDEIKPKFMKVMGEMMERWPNNYQNYEDLLTMTMNVKGMTHDQAEEEVMKRLVKDMPNLLKTSENMNTLMSVMNVNVLKYANELYPKYEAMMAEQSWKPVLETLKQSPAYEKYNKYYSENFYINLNLDMIHKHFVNENQREPGNVKTDIETLISYMKDFSMVYYLNNPKIQQKYNQDFLQMLIDYGRTVKGFDSKDTDLAAYETVLSLYSIYRNLDCSKWDLNYNGGYLKRQYKNVLDFIYRNK